MTTLAKESQIKNALAPIDIIVSGIVIELKEIHAKNRLSLIMVRLLGIVIEVNAKQYKNAPFPI
jgi:hypothetical protein